MEFANLGSVYLEAILLEGNNFVKLLIFYLELGNTKSIKQTCFS